MEKKNRISVAIATLGLAGLITAAGIAGSAQAAGNPDIRDNTVTSSDIRDETILSRDIATSAVGASELSNDSVGAGEIKTGSVGTPELSDQAKSWIKSQAKAGPAGKDGATGPQGEPGKDGKDGAPGLADVRADEPYTQVIKAGEVGVAFTVCPEGKAAIGGGYRLNGWADEAFDADGHPAADGLIVVASEPQGAKGGQLVPTYQDSSFPQDSDGRFEPNAWAVTIHNTTTADANVRVAVVCASVS